MLRWQGGEWIQIPAFPCASAIVPALRLPACFLRSLFHEGKTDLGCGPNRDERDERDGLWGAFPPCARHPTAATSFRRRESESQNDARLGLRCSVASKNRHLGLARPPGTRYRAPWCWCPGHRQFRRYERAARRNVRPGTPPALFVGPRNGITCERVAEPDPHLVPTGLFLADRHTRRWLQQAPQTGHAAAAPGARDRTQGAHVEQVARRARVQCPLQRDTLERVQVGHWRGRDLVPRRGGSRCRLPCSPPHFHHQPDSVGCPPEISAGARPAQHDHADDGPLLAHADRRTGRRTQGTPRSDRPGCE